MIPRALGYSRVSTQGVKFISRPSENLSEKIAVENVQKAKDSVFKSET